MKEMAGIVLLVSLIAVGSVALVSAHSDELGRFNPPTLGDKVADACSPFLVSDWHVDYTDETLLQVTCYNPKTQQLKTTVVER